jgi:hypothetical protein
MYLSNDECIETPRLMANRFNAFVTTQCCNEHYYCTTIHGIINTWITYHQLFSKEVVDILTDNSTKIRIPFGDFYIGGSSIIIIESDK